MTAEQPNATNAQDSTLDIAKRVYVYVIAATGLFLLAIGLTNLLELVFTRVDEVWSDVDLLIGGEGDLRRQLSIHVAMVLVALPIWGAHWLLAERWASRDERERQSRLRALYLAAALALSMVYLATALRDALYRLFTAVSSDTTLVYSRRGVPEALAFIATAGGLWAYHAWVRRRDERAGALPQRAQWPVRLYLYLAAFAGAMLLLSGVVGLLDVTVEALFPPSDEVVRADRWWAASLSDSLSNALVGLLLWGTHWVYSLHIVTGEGWLTRSERRAVIRRSYLYIAAFTGTVLALVTAIQILDMLFSRVLGVYSSADGDFLARLISLLLRLVPFGVLWLYHQRQITHEAQAFGDAPLQIGVRRLYTYGVALIGLAFAGIGLARLLALVLAALSSGNGSLTTSGDSWREQVSVFTAVTITGAATWIWQWYRVQRWLEHDPAAEREATTRRVYLYSALGGAMIALLGGLSVILYRVLSALLNVSGRGDFVSDISGPTGIAVVALLFLLYHGLILRSDLRTRPAAGPRPATQRLVLSGPPGADLDRVVTELRAGLPEGFALRRD